ncbi:MAG TPA: hypothetical protein VFV08_04035 [Puia sp.]|nr:hypothetical protein [Puia sp.]
MAIVQMSANQMWKKQRAEGITTLDFLPWLEREKTKAYFNATGTVPIPANPALNDSIQSAISDLNKEAGEKTATGTEYYLGIKKKYLWISGIGLVVLIGGIIVYKKIKKK